MDSVSLIFEGEALDTLKTVKEVTGAVSFAEVASDATAFYEWYVTWTQVKGKRLYDETGKPIELHFKQRT